MALGWRRRNERLGPIVLAGSVVAGVVCLSQALVSQAAFDGADNDAAALVLRGALVMLPALALHMLLSLPDGRLRSHARRRTAGAGYVVAAAVGVATTVDLNEVQVWPIVALWAFALGVGAYGTLLRYRLAGAVERRRIQWIGWGLSSPPKRCSW